MNKYIAYKVIRNRGKICAYGQCVKDLNWVFLKEVNSEKEGLEYVWTIHPKKGWCPIYTKYGDIYDVDSEIRRFIL